MVLENQFDSFFYSDPSHYVGYNRNDDKVVLKGFQRKNVPRLQLYLIEQLFLNFFRSAAAAAEFDFNSCFKRLLESNREFYALTFPYHGVTDSRHYYYNNLEDDGFVFSDEVNHMSSNPSDTNAKHTIYRHANSCFERSFSEYVKCLMQGVIKNTIVKSVLKADESVLIYFQQHCALSMNVSADGGGGITPNKMGSVVYSREYLIHKYMDL